MTAPLTSQGFNCYNQTSWNNSVPTGPLSSGSTGVTGMSWSLGTSTLAVTASGSSYLCSFFSPPGYANSSGGVTVTLTSPFDTVVAITASGGASSSGGSGSGPLPSGGGVANGSVVVDGVTMFSVSATQGSSPSQTRQVVVGPAGVQIEVQAAASASYGFGGTTGANLSMVIGWTQVDGANVVSVPGGCAAPTAIPTFVANGPARIGGLLDADILHAQGPSPLGFVMFGLEQAAIPLNVINMPGCTALQLKWVCLIATPVGPQRAAHHRADAQPVLLGRRYALQPGFHPGPRGQPERPRRGQRAALAARQLTAGARWFGRAAPQGRSSRSA